MAMNLKFPRMPWLAVWRPSIGRTMTLAFTVFGLIIGYITIIFLVMVITATSIAAVRQMVLGGVHGFAGSGEGDALVRLVNQRRDDIAGLFTINERLSGQYHHIGTPRFYYQGHADAVWKEIFIDRGNYIRERAVDAELARRLDASLHPRRSRLGRFLAAGRDEACLSERPIYHLGKSFFYGKEDRHSFAINITCEKDRNRYLIVLDVDRVGLVSFVRNNIALFLVFAGFLLVVSHALGHMFAWRLARPVKALAGEAARIASGEYSLRFDEKRKDEIGVLGRALNIMTQRTEAHIGEIERRMKTIETMNRIDKAVLSSISRKDLLDRVIGIVSSMMDCHSIGLGLRDDEKGGYDVLSYFDTDGMSFLRERPFLSDADLGSTVIERQREVFQLRGSDVIRWEFPQAFDFMGHGLGSLMSIPLFVSDCFLGSLVLTRSGDEGFTAEEERTAKMLADQVAVALQSVRSFEEREALFLGILLALTRSIDAKSRWTAGHSERVAFYAEAIGLRLGMAEEDLRTLTVSAILHDIGKFGVPESVLDKPGKLTEEEYAVVRLHPEIGANIIDGIPAYGRIVPGILYHHERWNGSGYPRGLAREDIPLNGRIIAAADVYDAIIDDRPYRKGWGRSEALDFLSREKGVMFDPVIIDLFLDVLADERFLQDVRQRRRSL